MLAESGAYAALVKKRAESRVQLFGPTYRAVVERVASNVRRLRAERGWTQEECAFQCGDLDVTLLRMVESGRTNITAATVARLVDGFGVDVRDLYEPAPPLVRKRGRPPKGDAKISDAKDATRGEGEAEARPRTREK